MSKNNDQIGVSVQGLMELVKRDAMRDTLQRYDTLQTINDKVIDAYILFYAQFTHCLKLHQFSTAVDWVAKMRTERDEFNRVFDMLADRIRVAIKTREKLDWNLDNEDFEEWLRMIVDAGSALKDALFHAIEYNNPSKLKTMYDDRAPERLLAIQRSSTYKIAQNSRKSRAFVYLGYKGLELDEKISNDWRQVKMIYQELLAQDALDTDQQDALEWLQHQGLGDTLTHRERRTIAKKYNEQKQWAKKQSKKLGTK